MSDHELRDADRVAEATPDDPVALVRLLAERQRAGRARDPSVGIRVWILPPKRRKPVEHRLVERAAVRGWRYWPGPKEFWLDPIGRPAVNIWRWSLKLGALDQVVDQLRKLRFVRWERVA